ncbi:MAG TPA: glycerate kinase, partial [Clostridiales bacterium]|nr:glycerate kinase [Clostridiales bacterium]
MRRIILVPDSFKGTMSSAEVCDIMSRAVRLRFPGAEAVSIPVADGGEGSVDA